MAIHNGHELERTFRAFADEEVAPTAVAADRLGRFPTEIVDALVVRGYLGAVIDPRYGGGGFDDLTFGLLCAAVGRRCTATRSLLTVQNMVAHAVARWGTPQQLDRWLPEFATGGQIAAFCLTEPDVGSDGASIKAQAQDDGDAWIITGRKLWVTFGQMADVFLVICRAANGPVAVLVPRGAPGLQLEVPVDRPSGMRGAMLANITLDGCRVSRANMLGTMGTGFSFIATSALDHGRHSIAWGCSGMVDACLDLAARHAADRVQFSVRLSDHQLIRAMLSDMVVSARTTRLLCTSAANARQSGHRDAMLETMVAKYHASEAASKAAADAVQIHGAIGCVEGHPAERFMRDAKVMHVIEGTDQLHQLSICELALRGVMT